jgi:type IV pilus assembly protein PilB
MRRKKLGEILQESGQISEANLQKLFKEQEGKMVRLGELILERGLVEKGSLIKALEEVSRVLYLDCTTVQCDAAVLQSVPKAMAVRLDVLPVSMDQSKLIVVMAEPQNVATIDELRFTTGKDLSPRFGFRAEIQTAIVQNYDHFVSTASVRQAVEKVTLEANAEMEFVSTSIRQANRDAIEAIQVELNQKRTPAVRLVSEIIKNAMDKQASDIHIEPQAVATAVRIRVDGVLRELESVPRNIQNSLVSRIKILSDMDIGERRAPQDGRFMVVVGQRKVDMRVSTLPTEYGEKVVMRLLETSANAAGDRAHRFGKEHDALFRSKFIAQACRQYRYGRGSHRIRAFRNQSGACKYARRAHLCELPAIHPAAGPECHHDWGNPRSGNRRDRDESGADRPHGSIHAAHE